MNKNCHKKECKKKFTFRLGEPGLDIKSTSALVTLIISLMSATKLGFSPMYFRVVMGLGLGLVLLGGLYSISFSSSELKR